MKTRGSGVASASVTRARLAAPTSATARSSRRCQDRDDNASPDLDWGTQSHRPRGGCHPADGAIHGRADEQGRGAPHRGQPAAREMTAGQLDKRAEWPRHGDRDPRSARGGRHRGAPAQHEDRRGCNVGRRPGGVGTARAQVGRLAVALERPALRLHRAGDRGRCQDPARGHRHPRHAREIARRPTRRAADRRSAAAAAQPTA